MGGGVEAKIVSSQQLVPPPIVKILDTLLRNAILYVYIYIGIYI